MEVLWIILNLQMSLLKIFMKLMWQQALIIWNLDIRLIRIYLMRKNSESGSSVRKKTSGLLLERMIHHLRYQLWLMSEELIWREIFHLNQSQLLIWWELQHTLIQFRQLLRWLITVQIWDMRLQLTSWRYRQQVRMN